MSVSRTTFRDLLCPVAALLCCSLSALAAAAPAHASDRFASVTGNERSVPAKRIETAATTPPKQVEDPAAKAAPSRRETVAVMVDRAKVIRLPDRTQTVIIGNPGIADVTMHKNGVVVLTGKSYGLTNVIALDANGAVLVESTVSVQAATDSIVVVQRGMDRESYSCTPRCQPSILLGDSTKYFGEVAAQTMQHNASAGQK